MSARLASHGLCLLLAAASVATAVTHADPIERPDLAKTRAQVTAATTHLETTISPNARWLAGSQSSPSDRTANAVGSSIFVTAVAQTRETRVTATLPGQAVTHRVISEKALAWAPDSSALAFLSDAAEPGQLQLYVMRVADRAVRRVTDDIPEQRMQPLWGRGPAWLNEPAWSNHVDYATVLANQGYYVFLPNPRGSAGFGESFTRANIKDMGGCDRWESRPNWSSICMKDTSLPIPAGFDENMPPSGSSD